MGTGGGNEPKDCGSTPHGSTIMRTRYESGLVAAGQTCQSEVQTATCDDGSYSSWSGSYTFQVCDVDSSAIVHVCEQPGVCHEFTGPDAEADATNACGGGFLGTACQPDFYGACDLSNVGVNPEGYIQRYYNWDGFMPDESVCTTAGGVWTAGTD